MKIDRPWTRLLLALATLALCVGALRRMAPSDPTAGSSTDCETAQISDIATLEGCLERRPAAVELLIDLGAAYETAGHPQRAAEVYRRAIAADPLSGDAHASLARLLLAQHDVTGALREAEAAGRSRPGNSAIRQIAADAAAAGTRR